MGHIINARIAARLEEAAGILEEQGANPFRVRAYRHAAETVRHLSRPSSTPTAATANDRPPS